MKAALVEKTFPSYLEKFEEIKKKNPGNFLVGNQLTWIDILIAQNLEFFQDTVDRDMLKGYPALTQLKKMVFEIPQIKKWVQERPPTAF